MANVKLTLLFILLPGNPRPDGFCSCDRIVPKCCGFIVGGLMGILIIVALALSIGSGTNTDSYSLDIGDALGKSSLLIVVYSPTSSAITFNLDLSQSYTSTSSTTLILLSDNIPSTITDYLPLQYLPLLSTDFPEFKYRGDYNYLGSNEPIYLLSMSSINYNLTITGITAFQSFNTSYYACLYLFTNKTHYNDFLMSVDSNVVYNDFHCFTIAVTTVATTVSTVSHSFNIVTAGQYYVGIQLQGSFTVQANASVVRVYFNTTGLQQQASCNDRSSCSTEVCNTFICNHEATTYFLVKPSNKMKLGYFFTTPRLHGSLLGGFIATLVLLWSCVCCTCSCFVCCLCVAILQYEPNKELNGHIDNDEDAPQIVLSNFDHNKLHDNSGKIITCIMVYVVYLCFSADTQFDINDLHETHAMETILQDDQLPIVKVEAGKIKL